MPSNTIYIPQNLNLDASRIQGAGQGVTATISGADTVNLDLAISDDTIITGLQLITAGSSAGDYIVLQVLFAGNVVATPIPGPWFVPMSSSNEFDMVIPVKILSGLTLRAVYHGIGALAVAFVAINYKLWKVLA